MSENQATWPELSPKPVAKVSSLIAAPKSQELAPIGMPSASVPLCLQSLENGMPGMEPCLGASCAHAAAVCLENQNHTSGQTTLAVDGKVEKSYSLTWAPTNEQTRRSWSDIQDATEWGASGVGALLVKDIEGLSILQRSWKGTGFDYWVGTGDNNSPMFQNKARLEVTGILHGNEDTISARLKEKTARFANFPHDLPAIVVVVEFGTPRSRLHT